MSSKYTNIQTAFAGANTGKGFVSFYERSFAENRLCGLYIIKGGAGTGKSTFMRRLGKKAVSKGFTVEHYLCGSDEASLDGVIIKGSDGRAVGVIDGTPPHARDLKCAGAAGDILNFGEFWDSRGLSSERETVERLAGEKSALFDTVYRYLGAAERVNRSVTALAEKMYLAEKASAAAARLVASVGVSGEVEERQLSGYTMNGEVSLVPTGEARRFGITGDIDIARLFLGDVYRCVKSRGISAQISRCPLDLGYIDSIYFPKTAVWLYYEDGEGVTLEKTVNTRRFTDKEKAAEYRQRLRFGKKCRASLIGGALETLGAVRERHFALERIYGAYMDFAGLSAHAEEWSEEILSRLD